MKMTEARIAEARKRSQAATAAVDALAAVGDLETEIDQARVKSAVSAVSTAAGWLPAVLDDLEAAMAVVRAAQQCYAIDGVYIGDTVVVPCEQYEAMHAALAALGEVEAT